MYYTNNMYVYIYIYIYIYIYRCTLMFALHPRLGQRWPRAELRMDGRTDGWMDGRTIGWIDGRGR